jgi:hypothetical protein
VRRYGTNEWDFYLQAKSKAGRSTSVHFRLTGVEDVDCSQEQIRVAAGFEAPITYPMILSGGSEPVIRFPGGPLAAMFAGDTLGCDEPIFSLTSDTRGGALSGQEAGIFSIENGQLKLDVSAPKTLAGDY